MKISLYCQVVRVLLKAAALL